jgi:hypothetical protein
VKRAVPRTVLPWRLHATGEMIELDIRSPR